MAAFDETPDTRDKQETRQHIRELIEVQSSIHRVKRLGGVSGAQIHVINHSKYIIDHVGVKVSYMKHNGDILQTAQLFFNSLKPNEMQHQYPPDSNQGHGISCVISEIRSTILELK